MELDRELRAEGGQSLSRDGMEVSTGYSQQAQCLSSACLLPSLPPSFLASPPSFLPISFSLFCGSSPESQA